MKRTIALLTLLGLVGTASASTIANWRFEEGTDGVKWTGDHDNHYLDDSGNGNHLSAWADSMNPVATSDVPFADQGGTTNTLAVEFDGWDTDNMNLGTWEWDGTGTNDVSVKMIDSYAFTNGWTIEATFKADSHRWGGILCKDGRPGDPAGFPNFHMKVRDDDKTIDCGFFDSATNNYSLRTDPIMLDRWYSVAITYDPATTNCSLFMKQQDGGDYVLQASTNMALEADLNLETGFWRVGNAMWLANPVTDFFDGIIDEVKISDSVLATNEFLNQDGFTIPFDVETPHNVAASGFILWDLDFDLTASPFWSPAGEIFVASDWQISTDNTFATLDWAASHGMQTITVPGGTLVPDTYYARVRYAWDSGLSEWSDAYELSLNPIETVAYWKLDELGNGERHGADFDGFYVDSSGHGNHMSSRLEKYRPVYVDDVACGSESTNTAAIKVGGYGGAYDNVEAGLATATGAEINSYSFTDGWTVEMSFMVHAKNDWMEILGKDGKLWAGNPEPLVYFKVAPEGDSNGVLCFFTSSDADAGTVAFDWLGVPDIIVPGKWYSIAATYDGSFYKLYYKSEDDSDYILAGLLARTQGYDLGQLDTPWTIGQGMWNGNNDGIFNGLIDDVRISNGALPPSHFLCNIGGEKGAYDMRSPEKVYLSNFTGLDSVMRLSGSEAFSPRGYALANSEWEVASDAGMTDVVWESGLVSGRNYVDVPPNSLPALGTYYIGVRYQASNGSWTDWTVVNPEFVNTLAYWRFEEGVNGATMATALDSSGNVNHLVAGTYIPPEWTDRTLGTPHATNTVPYSIVPQTWADNGIVLDLTQADIDYMVTSGTALEAHAFNNGWTVEATFGTIEPGWWQNVVAKDGKRSNGGEPQMRIVQRADTRKLSCDGSDTANTEWWRVDAFQETVANQWLSVAVTYDNSLVRMYVKTAGSDRYELQGSSNVPLGINLAAFVREWAVGCGLWDDHWTDALQGWLDEVRITDGALEPGAFIADTGAGWDSDGNGISDVWEIEHFGSIGVDPSADPDADGRDNLTEFLYGGDPNVADTGHAITYGAIDPGTGTNVFAYVYPSRKNPYVGGTSYSFETTDDLIYGTWTNDGSVVMSGIGVLDADFDAITNQVPMDTNEKFIKRLEE